MQLFKFKKTKQKILTENRKPQKKIHFQYFCSGFVRGSFGKMRFLGPFPEQSPNNSQRNLIKTAVFLIGFLLYFFKYETPKWARLNG
jgi:hypothetical protein